MQSTFRIAPAVATVIKLRRDKALLHSLGKRTSVKVCFCHIFLPSHVPWFAVHCFPVSHTLQYWLSSKPPLWSVQIITKKRGHSSQFSHTYRCKHSVNGWHLIVGFPGQKLAKQVMVTQHDVSQMIQMMSACRKRGAQSSHHMPPSLRIKCPVAGLVLGRE